MFVKKCQGPKTHVFDENQSCSYCDSVQDALVSNSGDLFLMIAPIIKLWGPLFDDLVDIPFFWSRTLVIADLA